MTFDSDWKPRMAWWTPRRIVGAVGGALLGVAALAIALGTYSVVEPGQRGVYVLFGETRAESLEPGLHWKNPFAEVHAINVQQIVYDQNCEASSSDLQTIHTSIAVNYRPEPGNVWMLYKDVGENSAAWENVLLRPAIEEVTKAVTARFTAEELIHLRADAKAAITAEIVERLDKEHVQVTEVSITDFGFNKGFNDAIEAKEIAEQRAKQAENDLNKVAVDAKQQVVRAEAAKQAVVLAAQAQAERVRLLGDAEATYQSRVAESATDLGLRLRMLERWDGAMPSVVGSTDGMMVDVGSLGGTKTKTKPKTKPNPNG